MIPEGARGREGGDGAPADRSCASGAPPFSVLGDLEALYDALCRIDLEVAAEERRAVVKVLAGIRSLAGWHEKRERARLALE